MPPTPPIPAAVASGPAARGPYDDAGGSRPAIAEAAWAAAAAVGADPDAAAAAGNKVGVGAGSSADAAIAPHAAAAAGARGTGERAAAGAADRCVVAADIAHRHRGATGYEQRATQARAAAAGGLTAAARAAARPRVRDRQVLDGDGA